MYGFDRVQLCFRVVLASVNNGVNCPALVFWVIIVNFASFGGFGAVIPFSVRDKLVEERIALRWKEDENPKALIKKTEMKNLIGHSPDWIEALLYCLDRVDNAKKAKKVRRGNWSWFGM